MEKVRSYDDIHFCVHVKGMHLMFLLTRKEKHIETRCSCDSYIKFKISNNIWKVIEFNPVFNHPFAPKHQRHLIRSHKRVIEGVKSVLDSFKSVCILSAGDAQSLVNHFSNLHAKDPMLFHTA
ncbi:hypothetical protein RJ639_011186 [Escallonia herrerae]|uniref:Uncharacterized protein n=1 Tax=Escallonia herrerae TaxID=1293975 RepID=A0AA88VNA0_9ASTE|nr:hypothetical protein RJ639_011186 [Escallonia herrerae]